MFNFLFSKISFWILSLCKCSTLYLKAKKVLHFILFFYQYVWLKSCGLIGQVCVYLYFFCCTAVSGWSVLSLYRCISNRLPKYLLGRLQCISDLYEQSRCVLYSRLCLLYLVGYKYSAKMHDLSYPKWGIFDMSIKTYLNLST